MTDTKKNAFTILINDKTGEPVRMIIPNELVTFPEDDEGETNFLFFMVEDTEGEFSIICQSEVYALTSIKPGNPNSMIILKTSQGDRFPVHTDKALLQMGKALGKLVRLNGGKE